MAFHDREDGLCETGLAVTKNFQRKIAGILDQRRLFAAGARCVHVACLI
jgi:hypothetical protein